MNLESIQNIICKKYGQFEIIEDNIYKALYRYKEQPISVQFFDCSERLSKPEFDLYSYQDQLLSEDFYRLSGTLQWNFYLFFICSNDSYHLMQTTGKAWEIEKDKIYAKKIVVSEEGFEQSIDPMQDWESDENVSTEDLSVQWIKELKKGALDGIYMENVPRIEVVRCFLSGNPIIEEDLNSNHKIKSKQTAIHPINISNIKKLKLDKYRHFSTGNEFDFGICNLIEGSNGTGKTSLLEAIEIWMCGKTSRNLSTDERRSLIGIKLTDDDHLYNNTTFNNTFYRKRDLEWYGNHYAKGNRLTQGFNRFNFFDTDAATHITTASDPQSINLVISSLILGKTVSIIEERLRSTLKLFKQEAASYNSKMISLLKDIDEAKQELKDLDDYAKGQDLYQSLIAELKRLKWTGSTPDEKIDDDSIFLAELNRALASLEAINNLWQPFFSFNEMSSTEIRVSASLKELKQLGNQISEIRKKTQLSDKKLAQVKEKTTLVETFEPYINNLEAKALTGLSINISDQRKTVERYHKAKEIIQDIFIQEFFIVAGTIYEEEQIIQKVIIDLENDIQILEKQIADHRKVFNRIINLKEEIRSRAKELISLEPDIVLCPVCSNLYKTGDLTIRVSQAQTEIKGSEIISEHITKKLALEDQLQLALKKDGDLKRIKNAVSLIFDSDWTSKPLSELIKRLEAIEKEFLQAKQELDKLQSLKSRLERAGLTEPEYTSIKSKMRDIYQEFNLENADKEDTNQVKIHLYNAYQSISAESEQLKNLIDKLLKQETEIINDYRLYKSPELELEKRYNDLRAAIKDYEKVLVVLSDSKEESLSDIRFRLNEILQMYSRYREWKSYKEFVTKNEIKNRSKLENIQIQFREMLTTQTRAEKAIDIIENLLSYHNKEKHLQQFLEAQKEKIVDIFKMLHSPREFQDIDFGNFQSEQISMIRHNRKESSFVTQISSGQRAALALSIFLSLNSQLKTGPPLIMLDDPLSTVDDMNTLSFFDYLREIVITGERQIFYATANQKVANLFKKKFGFLGDDFQCISLERTIIPDES